MISWDAWVAGETDGIRAAGRWRDLRVVDGGKPRTAVDGRVGVVSFASNDYLGLSQHPAVRAAAHEAIERWGAGAGSSRLIVGTRPGHVALEEALASWRGARRRWCSPPAITPTWRYSAPSARPGRASCPTSSTTPR